MELGGDAQALLDEMEEGGVPLDANDRYMCARFVQYLFDNKPEYSKHLSRLASIALLTEVVEDFLRPTSASDKSDLNIALDAPLALDLLGCSGFALRDDIKTIVEALRKIGCNFVVFPVSCREMQRNLRSMLSLPPTDRHGYTHQAMVKGEVKLDFVTAVANNPERALHNIGVTVRPLELESMPSTHRHFGDDKYEDFFNSIMWVADILPREHDATCAALVMRMREGRRDSDLFRTKFVLLTRNSRFVRHSRNYCLQSRLIFENQEGPAIDHRELATAAWLRTGLGAEDDVPKGHLIATCDRVLKTRPEVRRALTLQIQRLTPERLQQLNVLMLDSRSVQKLADVTLNDERVVTADNAEKLLETIRLATAEEQEQKHLQQLNEERTHFASQYEQSTRELDAIRRELGVIQEREAFRELSRLAMINRFATQCNTSISYFENIVAITLIPLCLVGISNYFLEFLNHSRAWLTLSLAFVLFGIYRGVSALLERPTVGLKTILNPLVKVLFETRVKAFGLDPKDLVAIYNVEKARVTIESKNVNPAASP